MTTTASTTLTTSQTIGPFSHEAWDWAVVASAPRTSADAIEIHGAILDGDGNPINDAMLEAWLPAAAPLEQGAALPGFRRVPSDDQGRFRMQVPAAALTAGEPAMYVTVFARGLLKHQFTAVFLDSDAGLAQSPILEQVPRARRATLIAQKQPDGHYAWNIHMQGAAETVFFDYA